MTGVQTCALPISMNTSPDEIILINKDKAILRSELAEAYHKAKADGSNPELVAAVEELLGKPKETTPTQYTEAATPKDDSAIQSGGEQKLPDQKEVPIEQKQEMIKGTTQDLLCFKTQNKAYVEGCCESH